MPKRSKVEGLPRAVKEWLDTALVEGNFSGYESLVAELRTRGCEVSKSALHRYGSKFEERMAQLRMATDQARAVVQASPDDAGDMTEALMRLVQNKVFNVLVEADIDPSKVSLEKLTLQVARLARATVPMKRYQAETRAKLKQVMDAAVAEADGGKEANALALLKKVREQAYGIFEDA